LKFSIIHPTARVRQKFEHAWWDAAEAALRGCDSAVDVEYILVVHHSRAGEFWGVADLWADGLHHTPEWGRFTVVTNYGRDCLVDQCNAGQLAATGEIHCWNQDDMRYPEHWDTEIRKLIPDTSELIAIQARTDGSRADLLTIPTIATRPLVEAIGLISPDYESMFSDDEWSAKAWRLGSIVKSSLYFQHLHPVNGTAEMDEVYALENRQEAYKVGFDVFQKRKAAGFPRVPYPHEKLIQSRVMRMQFSDPAKSVALDAPGAPGLISRGLDWLEKKLGGGPVGDPPALIPPGDRVIAICTPGDTFSFQWLESFLNVGSRLGQELYSCKRYMGHASNVYHARMDLASRVIEDAKISGVKPQYVLWLDSDNTIQPDQLVGLLRFMRLYPDVEAIFGWCWIRKAHGWTTSAGRFWPDDGVHLMAMNPDALFAGQTDKERWAPKAIEHSGFPCALIRYEAFEKLGAAAFRPLTKADLPAYFEGNGFVCPGCAGTGKSLAIPADPYGDWTCEKCLGTGARREVTADWFCGEDTSWCLAAKKAGMKLIVDPGCKLGHLKLQSQEPDVKAMMQMGIPEAEASRVRAEFNGAAVEVPAEYERIIS
jgi:hypothetical protein